MKPVARVGVVAAGYAIALLVASIAVAIRVAATSGPEAQASSGMYAFGDSVVFIGVFGALALVPTGAALHWLKPYRSFWTVLSGLGIGVAITSVAAAILFTVGRHAAPSSGIAVWAAFSVLRILLAPVLAPADLVCALFAPHRSPRVALLAAAVVEIAVAAYVAVLWFAAP